MRRRTGLWIILGILLLIGAGVVWRAGQFKVANAERREREKLQTSNFKLRASKPGSGRPEARVGQPELGGLLNRPLPETPKPPDQKERFKNRLSNTKATVGELAEKDNAILLANALLDTDLPISLSIPTHLQS